MNFGLRLDEILTKLENAVALNIGSQGMRGEAPKRSHWKAKQAFKSLIKELVAEAKPPAIDTSSRIKLYADDEGQMWYDRGQNDTIARFEQNLLKALEEV